MCLVWESLLELTHPNVQNCSLTIQKLTLYDIDKLLLLMLFPEGNMREKMKQL